MIGDKYLVQIAENTQKAIISGLYAYFYTRLLKTEEEAFAGELAAAIMLYLMGNPQKDKDAITFRENHIMRIQEEAKKLKDDAYMCEVLSAAAYNIGYGIYILSGGGRMMNRFLGYMRFEKRIDSMEDSETFYKMGQELDRKDKGILQMIRVLKELGLWMYRPDNPNELEYYNSIVAFAKNASVPVA
jgi:hypothetical protein